MLVLSYTPNISTTNLIKELGLENKSNFKDGRTSKIINNLFNLKLTIKLSNLLVVMVISQNITKILIILD